MKLYTVAVYDLRICFEEDNPCLKITREIIHGRQLFVWDGAIICDITHKSS